MNVPSRSPITMAFGSTDAPYSPIAPHMGVDFAYIPDNHIYAPFTGRVVLRPNNGNDGNGIYMYHPNGDFHGLLHSSQYLVNDGQQVSEGQPIAIMGATGKAFGVHVHWCVKRNGVFIDPMSLITKEEISMPTESEVNSAFATYGVGTPTAQQITDYTTSSWTRLLDDILHFVSDREKAEVANLQARITELENNPQAEVLTTVKENNSLLKKLLSIFNIK